MQLNLPRREYEPGAIAPLDGVRVLDLSRLVAGNVVTHMLADFGAEVIKIERPGAGDDLRNWRVAGVSAYFKVYCRNKKSVSLNLSEPRARELLLEMVESAHVLVENFKPGTLERWNLTPDVLLERNSKLVIVRISGWGQDGPEARKPGFGTLVEARSGFAAKSGYPDRPPLLPPLALADHVAGLTGSFAVLTALREVELKGGRGQVIDLPLFDPMVANIGPEAAVYQLTGEVPPRTGSRSPISAPRNVYRCKDGRYIAMSASTQAMAERLLESIGRPELIDDPRFRTNAGRVQNDEILDPIVAEFMASLPRTEILDYFEAAGVTVGPVNDAADLVDDPLIKERAIIATYPDEEIGSLPMHSPSVHLSTTPAKVRHPSPAIGEHNARYLGELGLSERDLEELTKQGVL
jgi:crotonobetainyl-CoA:carnitine CoA-transferase CaiB-like acyl-CoA transferase